MLIVLKDKKEKIVVKDILDIDFDMSVEEVNKKYYVNINRNYRLDEEFLTQNDAVDRMLSIANNRNILEQELRSF